MQAKPINTALLGYDGHMKNGRPSKSERTDFAQRLRALREAAGLSQRDVATKLEIAQPSYVAWENYNVALRPEQITQLSSILGVSIEELFGGDTKNQRGPIGKAREVFQQVNDLPRNQRQEILKVVLALLAQHKAA